jgi:HSP20 family protein
MTIRVWEPMREMMTLRDAMDRVFEDAWLRRATDAAPATYRLPIEVVEEPGALLVRAPVPGFAPDQIDISIHGDVLTIKGEVATSEERTEGNIHVCEWRQGNVQRSVQLPVAVEGDKAQAEHKNGVLTVRLPKAAQAIARKIEVQQS